MLLYDLCLIKLLKEIYLQDKERLQSAESLTLSYNGECKAVLRNPEFYQHRKEERCARQFGTTSPGHPYIKVCLKLNARKNIIIFKENIVSKSSS